VGLACGVRTFACHVHNPVNARPRVPMSGDVARLRACATSACASHTYNWSVGELVDRDQEHLRLLKWGFYITAGMIGCFSLFSLVYIGLGGLLAFIPIPATDSSGFNRRFAEALFLGVGVAFFLIGLTTALLTYFVGRSISERRRWIFCMIVAGLWCLRVPFGTAIGICAILVLIRPSVKALFDGERMPPAIPTPPYSG